MMVRVTSQLSCWKRPSMDFAFSFVISNPTFSFTPQANVLKLQCLNHLERKKESEVTQSCLTLCDPMDCSPPDSSIHGIFQARILEWVPFPSPGDLPYPGIEPRSPALQVDALPRNHLGSLSNACFWASPTEGLVSGSGESLTIFKQGSAMSFQDTFYIFNGLSYGLTISSQPHETQDP